jgi:UDP-N-acetylglucosamine 2-epimerase (hydrolysing)
MSKNNPKKIVFLSGTRADFGKLKSLIRITEESKKFEAHIFVTGMHLDKKFGYTIDEIQKEKYKNIYSFDNQSSLSKMDLNLSNTIRGFSDYLRNIQPDLIVVHGDRVEALAGAIVGSLNNILVAHIEGGEISGTIDELIRHAVSKMSHIHFAANKDAADRLSQLGELNSSIYIIGSPDLDLMNPKSLPKLDYVMNYYDLTFKKYSIAMFHPVTTEIDKTKDNIKSFVDALIESKKNYIVIYPNNDLGSDIIIEEYNRLKENKRFKIFPSLRFEYFLTLLYFADSILGNSSAGIREAPHYSTLSIDIGTRQRNRYSGDSITHCDYDKNQILEAINSQKVFADKLKTVSSNYFGSGDSDKKFIKIIKDDSFWTTNKQKQFQDIK